jgi:hypothetical protein
LAVLVVAAGGAGVAACGSVAAQNDGGAGDAPAETAPPTAAEACGQFASTLCGRLNGCAPYALSIFYGDSATCMSRVALGCMRDLEVPDTQQTPTGMSACARDANDASCDDLLANAFPTSCQIKPGTRLNGEGCGSSWQCMSTHCEKTTGECGVCAPRAAANGACSVDGGCTLGLVCAGGKCVTPGAAGAPCGAAAPCRANLYCSATTSSCAAPLALGASCAGDTGACDLRQGVSCNFLSAAPKCETVAAAKGGQACGIVNGTFTLCIALNACPGATLTQPGACLAPANDGQACNDMTHCLPPASCVGGLCRLPSTASCPK